MSSPNSEADSKDTVNSPPIAALGKRDREKLQLNFPQLLQQSKSEGGAHHMIALNSLIVVGFERGQGHIYRKYQRAEVEQTALSSQNL